MMTPEEKKKKIAFQRKVFNLSVKELIRNHSTEFSSIVGKYRIEKN